MHSRRFGRPLAVVWLGSQQYIMCVIRSTFGTESEMIVYAARGAVGLYGGEGTPVPIPNTAVKLTYAHNTWTAASREDRSRPTHLKAPPRKWRSFFSYAVESPMERYPRRVRVHVA